MSEQTPNEGLAEEQQAAALRAVQEAARKRDEATAAAQKVVQAAAVKAARLGAPRTRVRELAGVSPRVLYAWLAEAGIPVRAKAPRGSGKKPAGEGGEGGGR